METIRNVVHTALTLAEDVEKTAHAVDKGLERLQDVEEYVLGDHLPRKSPIYEDVTPQIKRFKQSQNVQAISPYRPASSSTTTTQVYSRFRSTYRKKRFKKYRRN